MARTCPDCVDETLSLIQVLANQGGHQIGLAFTAAGVKSSVWSGFTKSRLDMVHGFCVQRVWSRLVLRHVR